MEYEERYFLILGRKVNLYLNFEKMEDEGGDSARVSGLNICLPNPTMMDRQQPRVSNSGKCVTSESRSHYDTVIECVKYMLFSYYITLYAEYEFQCIKSGKKMHPQMNY